MSHFVGLVFGYNIEGMLEPYDENQAVEPYIEYTKQEAIDEVIENHKANYECALEVKSKNDSIPEWVDSIINKGPYITLEEAWEEAKKWGYELDEEDNLMSTYNSNSKWDWYCEGGRWGTWFDLLDGETSTVAFVKEVDWDKMLDEDKIPFCFVTDEGEWHEKAKMGWWALTSDDKNPQNWRQEFLDYLDKVNPETLVTVIDFHI